MTKASKHYWTVEHAHRALVAIFLLIGTSLWLLQDGLSWSDVAVFSCFLTAAVIDQLHGYICHKIEKFLEWEEQHEDFE